MLTIAKVCVKLLSFPNPSIMSRHSEEQKVLWNLRTHSVLESISSSIWRGPRFLILLEMVFANDPSLWRNPEEELITSKRLAVMVARLETLDWDALWVLKAQGLWTCFKDINGDARNSFRILRIGECFQILLRYLILTFQQAEGTSNQIHSIRNVLTNPSFTSSLISSVR